MVFGNQLPSRNQNLSHIISINLSRRPPKWENIFPVGTPSSLLRKVLQWFWNLCQTILWSKLLKWRNKIILLLNEIIHSRGLNFYHLIQQVFSHWGWWLWHLIWFHHTFNTKYRVKRYNKYFPKFTENVPICYFHFNCLKFRNFHIYSITCQKFCKKSYEALKLSSTKNFYYIRYRRNNFPFYYKWENIILALFSLNEP